MIKMSIAISRLPHLTRAQFLDYWREKHAPLVLSLSDALGIRRYEQLSLLRDVPGLSTSPAFDFDGVAEIWFDGIETIASRRSEPAARAAARKLKEDEARFVYATRTCIWWGKQHVIL